MIFLIREIAVTTKDSEDYFLQPDVPYRVIGTQQRRRINKDTNKSEEQDGFLVVNDKGRVVFLFTSSCQVIIVEKNAHEKNLYNNGTN